MSESRIDVGRIVDERPFGIFHVVFMAVSFLLMATDGYDLGAVAFAAPALVHEFGVPRSALGPLFSAGLISGLFGPQIFGYFADRFGRKKVIVAGAVFFGFFTLASVFVGAFNELIVLRFIAGIGMAGMLPIVVALNNEFAPQRFRATVVVLVFCGVTFGGAMPGFIAAHTMATYGWRLLFWVGGLAPIVIAAIVAFAFPESIKFLALRPERRAELVRVLRRVQPGIEISPQTALVFTGEKNRAQFDPKALFAGRLALLAPLFWISNACSLMVLYFVNQWMPTMLSGAGVTVAQAAIATSLFQIGGTFGGLVIMRPLDRYGFILVPILFALGIPTLVAIGMPGLAPPVIMALLFMLGICSLGLQFGNISLEPAIFPTYIRAWGVGSCFTAGRVGSSISVLIGGVLIGMHLPLQTVVVIAAIPLVVGFVVGVIITPLYRRQLRDIGTLQVQPALAGE
ncbi:MAG: MFS transporter [Alphaproteobacteria bacterium]|nr:MFS transporter [Alphaproteobacteria bacterium]